MENDFRNCQNISKVVKELPPNFTRTAKAPKGGRGASGHPRDPASVQKVAKVSSLPSPDPHAITAANNTPLNKQSTVCVEEAAVALREMPCSKDAASQQPALHVGHQNVDLTAMTNKSQKVFAKLPGLSNPLLHGLSPGDCDKARTTDITSLSFPNKGQPQQQKSLNYDVGHVFGDMSVAQSGGGEPNQAVSNPSGSSNNLFFRASHNTLQGSEEATGVCQSSLNTCSSSFADISHQNASESIKNNNFYDNSNTQNVNCKMILSGTGRETGIPVTRNPAQPTASDQPISTGESPKPDLPSTSTNPCRMETNTKSNMAITDPERLALIKQRKRERKFRKLQSLSALMRAPDDRHSMVQQFNPLRHNRITQENFKQESVKHDGGNYPGNSTGSSRLGDITQNPFNWMSSSVGASAAAGTGLNFEKKPWRADTGKKTCSFFHEPSMRNNSVLSENFSEMAKNRVDYKTEKKLIDSGSNSWQLHSSNSSVVDDALRVAALKHIKNEPSLDDHLLLSASGKVLDINSNNKRILENFLTPRVKKEDSGSESSSSVSSEEENCLSPKIKGLGCKEKIWGSSPGKKHRPQSKFGGNMVKFKNGETDSSSLDHFRSPLVNNYQKRTRDSADYEVSGVHSDKSDNTSEDETDNESDDNNSNDDDANNKSSTAKLFGGVKRKSYKAGVKRRGRPPLSDKFKSQSHKTAKRRGRPPLMSNFGKGEALTKQIKLEKPSMMEVDTKPQLKIKDDTADNKIPKRRGRPPKKLINPASASASPTPMSIDTPTPAVALSSLNAPTLVEGPNLVDISPTSPSSELTSEELLKARLNLPRRRGRPSKVDVMLREMAAAHLAAGQPMALPTPEAVAAALAQTAEVPAKKKKVYARRRYHAYGQRKRRRRKNTNLLRTLSTVAAEFDAGAEVGPSELAGGEEGASGVAGGGADFHQMVPAYDEVAGADDDDEEEEEDEEGEDMEGKVEAYGDRGSTAREEEDKALINKHHFTDRHHHRRHHRHHHHQLQDSQAHNNNSSHHRQLPLSSTSSSSSSLQPLPPSANIVVSLSHLSRRAEPAGQQQLVEEPNARKRQKKRKKDAGGEGDAKRQRGSGEVVSGTSVGGSSSNNNNNNNLKVIKQEVVEEEESVLLANGNTFRVKMMKSKPNSNAKGPASVFANLKAVKKEAPVEHGGEENRPAAAHTAEKPKSRNKKTAPSSSFSSSSTKAGVIKISRNSNNNNKTKTNNNSSSSSSSSSSSTTTTATSTTPAIGNTARQITPPVYNVPRVMLPPCIKDDGIACLMCGRVHTQDHFFKYMELKSTETSHRCPLCGQFFSWSCLFIEHMRGHPENTAQYRCEYCGSVSRKISSYFNCRITHCPPSQEWFDLQKACDDYLASLENKSSSAAAKKRRKAAAAASSSSTPSTKKKGSGGEGGGGGAGDGSGGGSGGGGGRSRKKPSAKQQEKDGANASAEKTQSSHASQQSNASESSGNCNSSANNNNNSSSSNNKRKGQKQSKGRRSSADTKGPAKPTKPFVCDVCEKTFPNLKLFTKHKETHKTETSEQWCKTCNKQFSSLAYLNAHKCSQKTAEGSVPGTNVCADSNSEGISAAAVDNNSNTNTNNSCGSSSSSSNFKCNLCDAVFPDALTLKNHIEVCDGLPDSKRLSGPHVCSICERSFKFKQSLLNHMRRHTGERPFACELCDKTFMQAGNLERHRRTHERDNTTTTTTTTATTTTVQSPVEVKPFICEYCEKAFTTEATYQTHLKEHDDGGEGNEQLHCPYCDEQFPSRHMLKLHKRTHNEHRPFKCSTCSRCYKHKHSLVEHQHQHNCR